MYLNQLEGFKLDKVEILKISCCNFGFYIFGKNVVKIIF